MNRGPFVLTALLFAFAVSTGCAGWLARSEGLDSSTLPDTVRPDYELFAVRCSKCHSLARPLSSGIDDDEYWAMYVARMRRQPGSGISLEDTVGILRFLHYFSEEQLKKKERHAASPPPAASAPPAPATPPAALPAPPPAPPSPPPSPSASGALGVARGRVL
jgi:hypothetical protein